MSAGVPASGLYLSDKAIAGRLGIGVDKWRATASVLEKDGLTRQDPLFANKRYWPAVRAFLDRRYGAGAASGDGLLVPDGVDHFEDERIWGGREEA